jgi:hypothetical protein
LGSDYTWLRCWHPAAATAGDRDAVLELAAGALRDGGYVDGEGRGLVALLDGPWVQLGDQAGSTEYQRSFPGPGPAELAAALSRQAPTVRMVMSDDAVLHLELWRAGARVDRYGTMHLRWELFADDEVDGWRPDPEAWRELVASGERVEDLAEVWRIEEDDGGWRGRPTWEVLEVSCRVLGWDPELAQVGFSHDADGIYIPWDGFLEDADRERARPRALTLAPPAPAARS